ncbi:MAG: DUF4129 domain-containing protein [Acidimicrobiales bacterium]
MQRVVAALGTAALFVLIAWLIYSNVHPGPPHMPRAARPGSARLTTGKQNRTIPIDSAAFGSTTIVLVAFSAFVLFRRRLRWLFTRPSRGRSYAVIPTATDDQASRTEPISFPALSPAHPELDPASEADPRLAVLLAYLSYSRQMVRAGLGRKEAETVFEFYDRVAHGGTHLASGADEAADRLTSLFSAARYGTEPVSVEDRGAAIECLARLSSTLTRPLVKIGPS